MAAHILITCKSTRAQIESEIRRLRAKQDRMPNHWVDRRAEVGDEIDDLVDFWLLAER